MSATDENIKKVEGMIEDVEAYVTKGAYHPDENTECARKLAQTDLELSELEGDRLSKEQTKRISELRNRFKAIKFWLPPPPWSS